jgi:hypothetical protein
VARNKNQPEKASREDTGRLVALGVVLDKQECYIGHGEEAWLQFPKHGSSMPHLSQAFNIGVGPPGAGGCDLLLQLLVHLKLEDGIVTA